MLAGLTEQRCARSRDRLRSESLVRFALPRHGQAGHSGASTSAPIMMAKNSAKVTGSGHNRPNKEHRPNDRYLICKRTLAKDTMNGRFWPKAAVALKPSRMSELGHKRTSGAIAI